MVNMAGSSEVTRPQSSPVRAACQNRPLEFAKDVRGLERQIREESHERRVYPLEVAIKDDLRRLIKAARDRESQELTPHVDDSPPAEAGRWTAKDNLAHLSAWRLTAASELDAARTGRAMPQVRGDGRERPDLQGRARSAGRIRPR